jgi:paraquat-inducible protein B
MAAAKPQKSAKTSKPAKTSKLVKSAKSTKSAKSAKSSKTAKIPKTARIAKTRKNAKAVALDEFLTLNIETRAVLEALNQALTRLERAIDRAQHVGIATPNVPLQEPTPQAALEDGEHEHDGSTSS